MEITLLGTGTSQGVPIIGCTCEVCISKDPRDQRLRTAALLTDEEGANIAIDCGPDFRQQMLRAKVSHLDAILITHTHNDHIIGLDDVRPFNFSMKRSIPVYGLKAHLDEIKDRFDYIFKSNPYPGAPQLNLHPIEPYQPFTVQGHDIIPILLKHGKIDVLGFRVMDKAYLTDTNSISDKSLSFLEDLDVLVLDALHHSKHHSHFNLEQAIETALNINAKKTYLIHISHLMGRHAIIDETLPLNIHLSYDGLIV